MWRRIKQFFTRLFHGSKLTLLSFQVYYHYKKIIIFPLFIAVGWTMAFMSMLGLFFYEPFNHFYEHHKYIAGIVVMLPLFFLISLINAFFKVATAHAVATYCQTNNASIILSCRHSFR